MSRHDDGHLDPTPAGTGPQPSHPAADAGTTASRAPLPLSDLRVLEMGQLLAGPFCGQLLGDFGAEVIKLEQPGTGDPMREWGREKPHGMSLWWPVVARNKRSVTVNLRTEEGQALVRRLVEVSDVVVENFRPGTMERWNLGYEQLAAVNPRIVMVRVTGFGQSGPYAPRAGYGSIGEAMGGLRYTTGDADRPPSRTGISIGDSLAGTYAAFGTMIALHARERTGHGQVVDSAIYEAVLAMMESLIPEYSLAGYTRERTGAVLPNVAPSNVYPCRGDDSILIAANQDTVFRRLAAVMGRPDLAEDARYETHSARGEHQEELDELIAAWSAEQDADRLLADLEDAGVPAGRIYRAKDMLADPHFEARDTIVRMPHPRFGDLPMHNVAPRLSATPGAVRHVGPELGEHTRAVLADLLGLDDEEIERLRAAGHI